MEKIIKILKNRFSLKVDITNEFAIISVFTENDIGLTSIFCNFNSERMSYSYIDFRDMIMRKEKFVSKKKLLEFIADLILYPKIKYKRIDNFNKELI